VDIFLSYAGEDRTIADAIAVGLRQEGHEVFFDRDRLEPGDGYHAAIRQAIQRADLFVFLISPDSVDESTYAMTELSLARERWQDPSGHILPVIVRKTPFQQIPAYLSAVTFLDAPGNLVANVLARIAEIAAEPDKGRRFWGQRRKGLAFAAVGLVAATGVAVWWFLKPQPVLSPSGSVADATTAAPLAGAEVSIRRGSEVLASDRSDADGRFRLSFDVGPRPEALNLKLFVKHRGFEEASKDVVVASGKPDSSSYRFDLLPEAVSPCRRHRGHAVVVGYFRPPTSATGDLDLSSRIRDALNPNLLTEIQKLRLRPDAQPIVIACGQARPQATSDYPTLAKALRADAFLSGYVSPSGSKFKVQMNVADRFDVLVPPPQISNPDVDLDDPQAARLALEAQKAILIALVTGYRSGEEYAECIEVTVAAERILGTLPPEIDQERQKCQKALPNHGLLAGGQR